MKAKGASRVGRGYKLPAPPSPDASRVEALRDLWTAAGLEAAETHAITVQRTFADFDVYWATVLGGTAPVSE